MRNISASLTTEQIIESVERVKSGREPVKDVTRRLGWKNVKVGERLQVCKKCMGRRKGEPLVKLAVIEVVSVRREKLNALLPTKMAGSAGYGLLEVRREGFRTLSHFGMNQKTGVSYSTELFPEVLFPYNATPTGAQFVKFFCATHKHCKPTTKVTRIEFKYIV